MTKILVFSDLHVHPHRFGAVVDPMTGRQSRLQDCLDALDWTANLVHERGCKARFFCGDLFHVRGRLAPSVLNPVLDHFRVVHHPDWGQTFCDFLLVGNHDMEHRAEGEHALRALKGEDVTILGGVGWRRCDADGLRAFLAWISYTPSIAALKEDVRRVAAAARLETDDVKKILLIHHGVDGAMAGIPSMGFGVADLPADEFDFIFCGDYHAHKELIPGKAWMVGAPLQHGFGDAGQRRGCMIVDLETGAWEHVENPSAPQFVALDATGGKTPVLNAEVVKGNFVRVRAEDEGQLEAIEKQAIALGARAVQRELVKDWQVSARADLSLSMTTGQMFRTWLDGEIKEGRVAGVDPDAVARLNDEILAEVGVS